MALLYVLCIKSTCMWSSFGDINDKTDWASSSTCHRIPKQNSFHWSNLKCVFMISLYWNYIFQLVHSHRWNAGIGKIQFGRTRARFGTAHAHAARWNSVFAIDTGRCAAPPEHVRGQHGSQRCQWRQRIRRHRATRTQRTKHTVSQRIIRIQSKWEWTLRFLHNI